jgi:hypothetical protein
MDEHARQARARRLDPQRREALDKLSDVMLGEVMDGLELRYLVDRLRSELSRRRSGAGTTD